MEKKVYSEKKFLKLVDKKTSQVFLFSCKVPFPFNIARHYWFVINKKGKLTRWEVNFLVNSKMNYGFIWERKRYLSLPFNKYWWHAKPRWKFSIIKGIVKGKLAEKMIKEIENSFKNYSNKNKYRFYRKPNSNTYVQWILDKFPEAGLKLNWRAFGK